MNNIWTITRIRFAPSFSSHVYCWWSNKEDAIRCVDINDGDIHEGYYEYVVIEDYDEGPLSLPTEEIWYCWDRQYNKYIPCHSPDEEVNCWAIG